MMGAVSTSYRMTEEANNQTVIQRDMGLTVEGPSIVKTHRVERKMEELGG